MVQKGILDHGKGKCSKAGQYKRVSGDLMSELRTGIEWLAEVYWCGSSMN